MEETIKQRQVPEENIQEINKFYEKMLALQLEKESADKGVTNESKKKKKKKKKITQPAAIKMKREKLMDHDSETNGDVDSGNNIDAISF